MRGGDGPSVVQPWHRSVDQVDGRHIKYSHLLPMRHEDLPIQGGGKDDVPPRRTLFLCGSVNAGTITITITIVASAIPGHLWPTPFECQPLLLVFVMIGTTSIGPIKDIGAVNHPASEPSVATEGRHGTGRRRRRRSGGSAGPARIIAAGKVRISAFPDLDPTALLGDDGTISTIQAVRRRAGKGGGRSPAARRRSSRQRFHGIVRVDPAIGRRGADEAGGRVGHQGHHAHGGIVGAGAGSRGSAVIGQIQHLERGVSSGKDAGDGGGRRGRSKRCRAAGPRRGRRGRGEQHLHAPIRKGGDEGRLLRKRTADEITILLLHRTRIGGSGRSSRSSSSSSGGARGGHTSRHRSLAGGAATAAVGAARHAPAAHGNSSMAIADAARDGGGLGPGSAGGRSHTIVPVSCFVVSHDVRCAR